MSYRIQMTPAAEAAVEAQVNWFKADEKRGGELLAERWFTQLHLELAKLARSPTLHAFAPENGKWQAKTQVRQMLFRPWKSGIGWRVLYAIDDKQKLVSILQIRHEHRRWLHEDEE